MKSKFIIKIVVDIILTGMFLVLMGYPATSLHIHEILGLLFFVVTMVHLILGAKWFKNVLFRLFSRKQTYMTYVKSFTSIVLVVNFIMMGLSGIFINRTILPNLFAVEHSLWTYLHRVSTYGGLILIAIHMGMYWNVVMGFFRRILKLQAVNKLRTVVLRILALIIAILGVKASFDRGMATKFFPEEDASYKKKGKEKEIVLPSDGPILKNTSTTDTKDGWIQTTTYMTSFTQTGRGGKGNKGGFGNQTPSRDFTSESPNAGETESDYLSRLTCTGCGRRCSLLTPQCGIGVQQAEAATEAYNQSTATENGESNESSNSAGTAENKVTLTFDYDEDSLIGLLMDYGSIMGLYIAGTYYSLEVIERVIKKNK